MSPSINKAALLLAAALISSTSAQNLGKWSDSIAFPLVPAAAAIRPDDGKLLVWSSGQRNMHGIGQYGETFSATYDPATGAITEKTISNTEHDMFCPGISAAHDGRLVVTGGSSTKKVSIHDASFGDGFVAGPELAIPRGYQSQVTLSDGRIFTIGGSWSWVTSGQPGSGEAGNKTGEVFDFATNQWTVLDGCPPEPMMTDDVEGPYRSDNHAWLFTWKDGSVFQAGPSKAMNWYYTSGSGSTSPAGTRDTTDAMCGTAVMYDAVQGKILTAGGSPNYDRSAAVSNAHITTIDGTSGPAETQQLSGTGMNHPRVFANAVTLPNGQVLILGGQTFAAVFTDNDAVTVPELFDPETNAFADLADQGIPRTYHSTGILLPDGTVFSGGGGLCDFCGGANHPDGQIFTPPYLLREDGETPAARPEIVSVDSTRVRVGGQITVTVGSADGRAIKAVLMRLGSVTHSVDTDSRRVPLGDASNVDDGGETYTYGLPGDAGVLLPGYYHFFVLAGGVPSVARMVKVDL